MKTWTKLYVALVMVAVNGCGNGPKQGPPGTVLIEVPLWDVDKLVSDPVPYIANSDFGETVLALDAGDVMTGFIPTQMGRNTLKVYNDSEQNRTRNLAGYTPRVDGTTLQCVVARAPDESELEYVYDRTAITVDQNGGKRDIVLNPKDLPCMALDPIKQAQVVFVLGEGYSVDRVTMDSRDLFPTLGSLPTLLPALPDGSGFGGTFPVRVGSTAYAGVDLGEVVSNLEDGTVVGTLIVDGVSYAVKMMPQGVDGHLAPLVEGVIDVAP